LNTARATLPNESRIPLLAGYIDRRQGRWEKSLEQMNRALELDPRIFLSSSKISLNYEALHRYKEMATTLDSVLAAAPKTFRAASGALRLSFNGAQIQNRCIRQLKRSWLRIRTRHLFSLSMAHRRLWRADQSRPSAR